MASRGYFPAPGNQQPTRYDRVGPNYQKYGEQQGWVYYAPLDQYFADPKYQKDYAKEHGYGAPEEPGLLDTLGPVAAAGGAVALGQGLGKNPTEFIGGLWRGGKEALGEAQGLLGMGENVASPVAETAAKTGSAVLSGSAPAGAAEGLVGGSGAGLGGAGGMGAGVGGGEIGAGAAGALPEAPGMFGLSGIGTAGNAILPLAGAAGAYDVLSHDVGPLRGGVEGAASGAAIGSYFGPQGAMIGAGVGGLIGLGKGLFEHESTKEVQSKRESGLAKKDPNYGGFHSQLLAAREAHPEIKDGYNPNVSDDFVGVDPSSGVWTNNQFAKTHDVGTLKADDIWGTPDFFKHYPDWLQKSEAERRQIADTALQSGAVSSKKGGIYVDFKKVGGGGGGNSAAQAQVQQAAPALAGMMGIAPPNAVGAPKAPTGAAPAAAPPQIVNNYGGVRVSPGVYKDAKSGETYYSKSGAR